MDDYQKIIYLLYRLKSELKLWRKNWSSITDILTKNLNKIIKKKYSYLA